MKNLIFVKHPLQDLCDCLSAVFLVATCNSENNTTGDAKHLNSEVTFKDS